MLHKIFIKLFTPITVLVLLLPFFTSASVVKKEDDFEIIIKRRREVLTGGTKLNKKDPDIQKKINAISIEGNVQWQSMEKVLWRSFLWKDLANINDIKNVVENFSRLRTMALSYSTERSKNWKNKKLRDDIIFSLEWLYKNQFNQNLKIETNSREYKTEIPLLLNDIIVLMNKDLSKEQKEKLCRSIFKIIDSDKKVNQDHQRIDELLKYFIFTISGAILKDEAAIDSVIVGLNGSLKFVTSGNGFYQDGSFIGNGKHPYNGALGVDYFSTVIDIIYVLKGTAKEASILQAQNLKKWLLQSLAPITYEGEVMEMVMGKEASIPQGSDKRMEQLIGAGLKLSKIFPADIEIKERVLNWIDDYDLKKLFAHSSLSTILDLKEIRKETIPPLLTDSLSIKLYWNMDRVVVTRPSYSFGIAMFSKRISNYESIHGYNLKGWYSAFGTTYLYLPTVKINEILPAINPYKMPGTTVSKFEKRPGADQSQTSDMNWVGGAQIGGKYGAIGMALEDSETSLKAKKSWFLLGNEIVALGTGIKTDKKNEVETIIENKKIDLSTCQLVINGEVINPGELENKGYSSSEWIHLKPTSDTLGIGYYFPKYYTVNLSLENKSVKWNAINSNIKDTSSIEENFFIASFNHGLKPSSGHYQYCIVPAVTLEEMKKYDRNPGIVILENNNYVQAVKDLHLNLIAANFWSNQKTVLSVNGSLIISADQPVSLIYWEKEHEVEISISDPTQENSGVVNIEIQNSNILEVLDNNPEIVILNDDEIINMCIDLSVSKGETLSFRFRLKEKEEKQ